MNLLDCYHLIVYRIYKHLRYIHKKYGGKGIHYVGKYTQAHLTLWIRRMVGMLQLKK